MKLRFNLFWDLINQLERNFPSVWIEWTCTCGNRTKSYSVQPEIDLWWCFNNIFNFQNTICRCSEWQVASTSSVARKPATHKQPKRTWDAAPRISYGNCEDVDVRRCFMQILWTIIHFMLSLSTSGYHWVPLIVVTHHQQHLQKTYNGISASHTPDLYQVIRWPVSWMN